MTRPVMGLRFWASERRVQKRRPCLRQAGTQEGASVTERYYLLVSILRGCVLGREGEGTKERMIHPPKRKPPPSKPEDGAPARYSRFGERGSWHALSGGGGGRKASRSGTGHPPCL